MQPRKACEVVLGGTPYYFAMTKVEAVEHRLREKIEVLIDGFSDEQALEFFKDFVRAAYRRRTAQGMVADDEAAVAFLNSSDFDALLRMIFLETPDPEESLADFVASVAWNIHDIAHANTQPYNIFDEGNLQ